MWNSTEEHLKNSDLTLQEMQCTSISETHYLMLLLSVKRFIWIPSIHCGQNKFFSVDTGDVISTVLYRISVGHVFPNSPPPMRNPCL